MRSIWSTSRFETQAVIAILIVAILISAQPASAHLGTPLYSGNTYELKMNSISSDTVSSLAKKFAGAEQAQVEQLLRPPPAGVATVDDFKPMTLTIESSSVGLHLTFRWTRAEGWEGWTNQYILLVAFDFNDNGFFEDQDKVKETVDDALGLLFLGFEINIGNFPNCGDWGPCFVIPPDMYVESWDAETNALAFIEVPLDRYGNAVAIDHSFYISADGRHTIDVWIPRVLFQSPTGFGFGLAEETGGQFEHYTLVWSWPMKLQEKPELSLTPPETAMLLGDIDPRFSPVGGVIVSADRSVVFMQWLIFGALGAATAAVATAVILVRRRR